MALTLSSMQTEVYARGVSDLNDSGAGTTRVTRWLNDSMHLIDEQAGFLYLRASTTGAAPLTISDLRTVESVTAVSLGGTLQPADPRDLADEFVDLTTTGTPSYYYFTAPTTIAVYPVASTTLTVSYFKFGPDLASASDAPLMPDRFRMAIVCYAAAYALEDRGDFQGAQVQRAEGDLIVQRMVNSLLMPQVQAPAAFAGLIGDDC